MSEEIERYQVLRSSRITSICKKARHFLSHPGSSSMSVHPIKDFSSLLSLRLPSVIGQDDPGPLEGPVRAVVSILLVQEEVHVRYALSNPVSTLLFSLKLDRITQNYDNMYYIVSMCRNSSKL